MNDALLLEFWHDAGHLVVCASPHSPWLRVCLDLWFFAAVFVVLLLSPCQNAGDDYGWDDTGRDGMGDER